jgi:8-oxo-dGTP pyrophosphatase MutT (NUDIX family)
VAEARPAATVVVLRPGPTGPEVLLLQRSQRSGFFPHAWVFPGGRVDAADHAAPTRGTVDGLPEGAAAFAVAAVRECFEEAGVWLGDGEPAGDLRDRLNARQATLADAPELVADLDRLEQWAWWITPEVEPKRYDTRFFVTAVTPDEVAHAAPDSRETVDARWLRPADALAAGDVFLAPPTFRTLEELAALSAQAGGDLDGMMRAAAERPVVPIQPKLEKDAAGAITIILPGDPEHPSAAPAPGPKRIVWRGTGWRSEG